MCRPKVRYFCAVLVCAVAIQLVSIDVYIWYERNFWIRDGACQQYFSGWKPDVVALTMERIEDAPDYHCERWLREKEWSER